MCLCVCFSVCECLFFFACGRCVSVCAVGVCICQCFFVYAYVGVLLVCASFFCVSMFVCFGVQ